MPASLMPMPKQAFYGLANGVMSPIVGGKVYTYEAGTLTPKDTYTTAAGDVANPNPVILDARGEASVWLGFGAYKIELKGADDALIWTQDGVRRGSDSSTIDFQQAGTGAVGRTAQAKMREIVSVKDFGAVGDGVADDTAAIQAAIDYCTNLSNRKQTLYIPGSNAGKSYKITAPLTVTKPLNIVGDGEYNTIINAVGFTAGKYAINFDCLTADTVYHCGIENIRIMSDNRVAGGVRISNASYMVMKQVALYSLDIGVLITGTQTFSNFFEQVTGYDIVASTFKWDSFTGGGQYTLNGCTFTGADGVIFSTNSATDSLVFFNCNFEQCVTTDAYIAGSVRGLNFIGCRSEGLNGGSHFLVAPTSGDFVEGLIVQGCTFISDFGDSNPVSFSGAAGVIKGFSVTGCTTSNAAALQFVMLAGAGESGVISGNYLPTSPKVVDVPRAGVITFANSNSSGALPDYWGTAAWAIAQSNYVASATGMTTTPTGTVDYSIVGNTVTLDIPSISGTSNATSFTLTGMPANARPAKDKDFPVRISDNGGTSVMGFARIKTTGVIEIYAGLSGAGFTASGTKTLPGISLTYTRA